MFSSQNTEHPKLLGSEYNSVNQVCKTSFIPRLLDAKGNSTSENVPHMIVLIGFHLNECKPTRLLGRK